MFDNDQIINRPTTITICLHTKMHRGNKIHNINIHPYATEIIRPILDSSAINRPTEHNTTKNNSNNNNKKGN